MPNSTGDSHFAGLSRHHGGMKKYADAEYVKMGKRRVRKLTEKEIGALRQQMGWIRDRVAPPVSAHISDRCRPKPVGMT